MEIISVVNATDNTPCIKLLTKTAKVPTRGSEGAAGYDLYADSVVRNDGDECRAIIYDNGEVYVPSGSRAEIHTGISVALPKGHVGLICPRSGLSVKQGLRLQNTVGVIDDDYRGEILVMVEASPTRPAKFKIGDRVAQMIILPYAIVNWNVVEELDATDRGEGGFGSTGK